MRKYVYGPLLLVAFVLCILKLSARLLLGWEPIAAILWLPLLADLVAVLIFELAQVRFGYRKALRVKLCVTPRVATSGQSEIVMLEAHLANRRLFRPVAYQFSGDRGMTVVHPSQNQHRAYVNVTGLPPGEYRVRATAMQGSGLYDCAETLTLLHVRR